MVINLSAIVKADRTRNFAQKQGFSLKSRFTRLHETYMGLSLRAGAHGPIAVSCSIGIMGIMSKEHVRSTWVFGQVSKLLVTVITHLWVPRSVGLTLL